MTQRQTGSTKFALNNADIVKLRSEYRDLAAKAAELESSLGPKHATVLRLHKQMDELRTSIRDQEQLIADSYANEYQMAKARETELAATVARLVGETGTSSQDQATMRQLESSADTLRNLYNSFHAIQYSADREHTGPECPYHYQSRSAVAKEFQERRGDFVRGVDARSFFGRRSSRSERMGS